MALGFPVKAGWAIFLKDAGLHPAAVLRRAELPRDLFSRPRASLSTAEYFRLWSAIEAEAADPALAVRLTRALSVEGFDPAIFAALCSENLNTALLRIAHYKRLIMPLRLNVASDDNCTRLGFEWLDSSFRPPPTLMALELLFFVQLARIGTRERVVPTVVQSPYELQAPESLREYLGIEVTRGAAPMVEFASHDASRPFLTANEPMWKFFEPDLRRRLFELEREATAADRVRAALVELLPGGSASMASVASELGWSTRTLQRRLKGEATSFQTVLTETRESLARHYLRNAEMSGAEISFLLGYEDPNSFFRAFHTWTGETPEQARRSLLASGPGSSLH